MKTRVQVLATSIFDVPGMGTTACRRIAKKYWEKDWWVQSSDKAENDRPMSYEEREDRIKNDPPTLEDIIQAYPWKAPARPLVDFAINHGLTRVDWFALPYDEEAIMAQLRRMDTQDVIALPLLVFGFLNRASGWVHTACGLVSNQRVESATIAQFLAGKREVVDPASRSSTSHQHLVECLCSLDFTGEVLESGRDYLARSIRRKYGLSPKRAEQVVDIAIQEGWLDKIQLV